MSTSYRSFSCSYAKRDCSAARRCLSSSISRIRARGSVRRSVRCVGVDALSMYVSKRVRRLGVSGTSGVVGVCGSGVCGMRGSSMLGDGGPAAAASRVSAGCTAADDSDSFAGSRLSAAGPVRLFASFVTVPSDATGSGLSDVRSRSAVRYRTMTSSSRRATRSFCSRSAASCARSSRSVERVASGVSEAASFVSADPDPEAGTDDGAEAGSSVDSPPPNIMCRRRDSVGTAEGWLRISLRSREALVFGDGCNVACSDSSCATRACRAADDLACWSSSSCFSIACCRLSSMNRCSYSERSVSMCAEDLGSERSV